MTKSPRERKMHLCANCGCYHCSDFARAKTKDRIVGSEEKKSVRTTHHKSGMVDRTQRDYYLTQIEIQIRQQPQTKLLKWEDIPQSKHMRQKLQQFSRIVESRHIINDFNRLSTDAQQVIHPPRISHHRSSNMDSKQLLRSIPVIPTIKTAPSIAKMKQCRDNKQCLLKDNRCLGLSLCGDDPCSSDSTCRIYEKLLI